MNRLFERKAFFSVGPLTPSCRGRNVLRHGPGLAIQMEDTSPSFGLPFWRGGNGTEKAVTTFIRLIKGSGLGTVRQPWDLVCFNYGLDPGCAVACVTGEHGFKRPLRGTEVRG